MLNLDGGVAMPIAYIERTRERYASFRAYRWVVNTDAPWTPVRKPLRESRLALVSSGGFYVAGQPPFGENDLSYRLIPRDTRADELRIFHHGYRDDDPDRDPNCVFPIDRLRELVTAGVIGELAPFAVGFVMTYSARREQQERAPKIAEELRRMEVDAALCVPV
jgi:D-proline reductase (dithiol) PrdB